MMRRLAMIVVGSLALLLLLTGAAEKPPAQFISTGAFSGGTAVDNVVLNSVRFGHHSDYTRMVLDLSQKSAEGRLTDAQNHPVYRIEYKEFPYRLEITLQDVWFDADARVAAKPALPFSIVAREDGTIKHMQVFLNAPSEFKVIEIDDPAKLSIDVRPTHLEVPSVYTVQLLGPEDASAAYALVEQGSFPEGYNPSVLVMGEMVVVEQAYADITTASEVDAALKDMGYSSVINERMGNELPQP